MGRYFGTDGFRGEAGSAPSGIQAYKIGAFFGAWSKTVRKEKPRILLGKDTRLSSDMLKWALASGLMSAGADVYFSGVVSTPSLAFLVLEGKFDGGVMISASHNVYSDNGIKLFSSNGEKLSDAICDKIEDYIDGVGEFEGVDLASARGEEMGKACPFCTDRYEEFLINSARCRFDGMRIALDCANGSASSTAKRIFSSLGAKVHAISFEPDGKNINRECGSTHPEALSRLVASGDFDAGFAFDGDADRCIAVDKSGRVLCGDEVIFLLAKYMRERGELGKEAVVATVMSNLGLHAALEREGIRCVTCPVGDRFVWETMQKYDFNLGGEQSGHVIIRPYLHTGDGILTAIKVLEAIKYFGIDLRESANMIELFPQYNIGVRVKDKSVINEMGVVQKANEIRNSLCGRGRLILRPSGTESIIRIMVEAMRLEECRALANEIETAILNAEGEL